MVCDQPFCISYLAQLIQKLSAMSIIINGISCNNYSDSDIPWKFCTSKTESL